MSDLILKLVNEKGVPLSINASACARELKTEMQYITRIDALVDGIPVGSIPFTINGSEMGILRLDPHTCDEYSRACKICEIKFRKWCEDRERL